MRPTHHTINIGGSRLGTLEANLTTAFRVHPHATAIDSMPGFGPVLGAMLLVAAGDLRSYPDQGHLAAAAGLVPVPKDSGRRVGNVHKPRRDSRPLRHALCLSGLSSLRTDGANRDYYQKKRAAGRTHKLGVDSSFSAYRPADPRSPGG